MENTERTKAIMAAQGTYFTGKPCKNGHVSKRYTQSGSCETCIRTAKTADPAATLARARFQLVRAEALVAQAKLKAESINFQRALQKERRERALARKLLKTRPFLLHLEDETYFSQLVSGLTNVRFPHLQNNDVLAKKASQYQGNDTWLVFFRVHPDDYQFFHYTALDLAWERKSESDKKFIIDHPRRKDGWLPPPARGRVPPR